MISQAIDLAIKQRQGEFQALTIEHVALDGGSDESGEWSTERERGNALAAAGDPSVVAYIGPYNSGAAKISLPTTNKAGLLHGSPTTTWPGLTEPGWEDGEPGIYYPTGARNFVRLMPSDAQEAVAAAQWAAALELKRAYVLNDGSAYSIGLARRFVSAAPAHGLEVVDEGGYDLSRASDIADQIARSHADMLFYAPSSTPAAVALARALEKAGAEVSVIVSDTAINEQFAETAGESALNWRFIHNYAPLPEEAGTAQTFTSAFRQTYGAPPSLFAANAYDLTNLVLDAIKQAGGSDRAAITRLVRSARGYAGASGAITFDENGDRIEWSMSGYRLANGKFVVDTMLTNMP
ncbi:MAG TPA: branched-chain amino acid ABC transporter substrate-binding protein [Chloroflexia bacterium]|nr:branched-chain amino acid ABC transporter substrate-binding protein [Chloroflexia bacterium]